MKPIVLAEDVYRLEKRFEASLGLPPLLLMENAAQAMCDWIERTLPATSRLLVLAGPGNNGGDGIALARRWHQRGRSVTVLLFADPERLLHDAQLQYKAALASGIQVLVQPAVLAWQAVLAAFSENSVLIDALFGVGLQRPLEETWRPLLGAIHSTKAAVVSVDIPSGMHPDQGLHEGTSSDSALIVRADHTLTLGYRKLGLYGSPGFPYAGHVTCLDIGLPVSWAEELPNKVSLLEDDCLGSLQVPLDPLAHKGVHGHVMIASGSTGKAGAALLCAAGALQVGVGLCSLLVPEEIHSSIQGRIADCLTVPFSSWSEVPPCPPSVTAYVVGPGSSADPAVRSGGIAWIEKLQAPAVLDADALNWLAGYPSAGWRALAQKNTLVITPHPAEAARLLGINTEEVQRNRLAAVRELVALTQAVVVLKGARTLIAAPEAGQPVWLSPTGNPAMGVGGMGDVLAGMIGALLARGFSAPQSAYMGAYLHGALGDALVASLPAGHLLQASAMVRGSLQQVGHGTAERLKNPL